MNRATVQVALTDKARLDWLQAQHTLHRAVEVLYVVDGYELTVTYDGNPITGYRYHGDTLRAAIDLAIGYK